ncbi:MAG TPA: NAD(P)/FAD-dependent oxidoreductase [Steroidobacteraceae bacterium]|nr:NAD(P)/FAD-dependent oxidoreductase [Steroidobacteraceae bacterium]
MMASERRQIVVIGAGPAGSIAAALLRRHGRDVLVLERQRFPRFSIGESLLVHCLDFVAEAGMIEAVDCAGFQYKNGAAFSRGEQYGEFDFCDSFTPGRVSTYEVERAPFDKLLADEAQRQGVEIRYETEIVAVQCGRGRAEVTARAAGGSCAGDGGAVIEADFVLDASGFGRTLPRLLGLERPSAFPVRHAMFTHVADHISGEGFDRNKILITVHPQHRDVWYWLIPFSGGRASIGVVARKEFFAGYRGSVSERLRGIVNEDRRLARLLAQAEWDTPAREIGGYSANVTAMHGPGFALLGNAAEFLDPVFSSGVTIAMRSASMAVHVLERQLKGAAVDWEGEFERPLRVGIDCFREFVSAWYDGRLHEIFFSDPRPSDIRRMVCSVLAGYAWDRSNPFVAEPRRRLDTLAQLCTLQNRART